MNKKEILSLISNEIRSNFLIKKITDIKYNSITKYQNDQYDFLYIIEFLALYKIEKLEKLNLITKEVADNLRELLNLKIKLQNALGEKMIRNIKNNENEEVLNNITNKIIIIDAELNKYHILPLIEDLDLLMEIIIKNENYDIKDNGEQKELIKTLKQ